MSGAPTPTISRELPDGTLLELVYDAGAGTTALAVARPGTPVLLQDRFELASGEVLGPYSADNALLSSGCVLLPSSVGGVEPKGALLGDIKAFLHKHVDFSPLFEEIAAHYVLFSWVHDAFNEAPMLRLRGEYGTGKTRGLLAIGSLCHKAFFASGASTVSPIFHILDAFQGTLVLDEADLRFSDATTDLVKILNNGTVRGLPVLRTMTTRHRELQPAAFRVFGPKVIAMREHFQDDALESRFLTEEMGRRTLRPDIALTTPDSLRSEAQLLRDRLLAWRLSKRYRVRIDPTRVIPSLSPRGNQMALPLLSIIDNVDVRHAVGAHLVAVEARASAKRAALPHIAMVSVLDRMFREHDAANLPLARVADEYNAGDGVPLPVKAIGHIVRKRLGLETRKSAGVYVIPGHERGKVAELVERHLAQRVAA